MDFLFLTAKANKQIRLIPPNFSPHNFQEFPKIPKDVRTLPKIAVDYRGRPEDLSMIHQLFKVQFV